MSNLKELLGYMEYAKMFIYISIGTIILTSIIYFLMKDFKLAKYIPGIILIGIGLISFFTLDTNIVISKSPERIMLIFIGLGCGLIGILSGWIIDIFNKSDKTKKKGKRVKEQEEM
ncbi:hypothetical protein [Wansuia hejianensis]|uniref:Uncharacterized protein n=1 Tax=Wansuia hejianensis TaxID=2763667 RepID=A0A926F0C5_9FIRM|nr:hypothetical protein [Wansuia hejianensis]MBC8589555.1 hypothetical protein [Wansuia hejianensis]